LLSPVWFPAAVGLVISAYLFGLDLFGASAVCFAQSGCDSVRLSAYGTVLGIHVSAVGVLFFATIFALCLTRTRWRNRWLQPLAAAGGGAAFVFAAVQFVVIRAVCPYCLLADASAMALAYLVVAGMPPTGRVRAGATAGLAVVILSAIYATTAARTAESEYAAGLARYLTRTGVVFYGAYWCPHCRDQKALFGSAASLLPYVECDPRGANPQPARCLARGIRVYPTWEFGGQLVEGVLALDDLARRAGYPPPPRGP
jgi:uncharacterized membrane protein